MAIASRPVAAVVRREQLRGKVISGGQKTRDETDTANIGDYGRQRGSEVLTSVGTFDLRPEAGGSLAKLSTPAIRAATGRGGPSSKIKRRIVEQPCGSCESAMLSGVHA